MHPKIAQTVQPVPVSLVLPTTLRDERGYTLQTLIITAVVVLLAVAAGVVIMAITRSAQEDLEGIPPKTDGPCMPWEIHDVELAAAGAGGGQEAVYRIWEPQRNMPRSEVSGGAGAGGVTSSAVGCLAPCYLTLNDRYDFTLDLAMLDQAGADALMAQEPYKSVRDGFLPSIVEDAVMAGDLKFDVSNRPPNIDYVSKKLEVRIGVVYERRPNDVVRRADMFTSRERHPGTRERLVDFMALEPIDNIWNASALRNQSLSRDNPPVLAQLGWKAPPVHSDGHVAIRVSASQDACEIYHKHTGEVLVSSRDV